MKFWKRLCFWLAIVFTFRFSCCSVVDIDKNLLGTNAVPSDARTPVVLETKNNENGITELKFNLRPDVLFHTIQELQYNLPLINILSHTLMPVDKTKPPVIINATSIESEESYDQCEQKPNSIRSNIQNLFYFGNKQLVVQEKVNKSEVMQRMFPYNETFTREIMHPLAAAAFALDPQLCLTRKLKDAKVYKKIVAKCGPLAIDECSGYTAVSDSYKAIIISLRGTTQLLQFFNQRYQVEFEKKLPIKGGGKVGKYYLTAFNSIWTGGMEEDFNEIKHKYPSYDLWITGYSLGGSMAAVASHVIAANKWFNVTRMKVVTFGEPRTGDRAFAIAHNKLIPVAYRVVGKDDIIPQLPLVNTAGYKHYNYEVWYNNRMSKTDKYKLCMEYEDSCCSTKKADGLSVIDHLIYYQRLIFGYADLGCVN